MDSIEEAIMNALKINMGHKTGEEVVLVGQQWDAHLGEETKANFQKSKILLSRMYDVFRKNSVAVRIVSYSPKEARHGVDAGEIAYQHIGNSNIIFMPTAYSLSHTAFRKALTEKGARIASMPTFTLEMFEPGGPMGVDYKEVNKKTEEIGDYLRNSKFVRVNGRNTDILVEIDPSTVHVSSGLMREAGEWGNLPGAEAYVAPVHEGNTFGIFTVPVGWGGDSPIKYNATFFVKDGRIVEIKNLEGEKGAQEYIDQVIKPQVFGTKPEEKDFNILAELGIGTNPAITPQYIAEHGWSPLTAEKIIGSAHFANGNSKSFGGKNDVPIHIDWVVPNVKIKYQGIELAD